MTTVAERLRHRGEYGRIMAELKVVIDPMPVDTTEQCARCGRRRRWCLLYGWWVLASKRGRLLHLCGACRQFLRQEESRGTD